MSAEFYRKYKRHFDAFYATRQSDVQAGATYESHTREAFITFLQAIAKDRGWQLIRERPLPNGRRPDVTFEQNAIPRGYYEAKDIQDDLDREIERKFALGYPKFNILFEDTRQAVLYQDGVEARRASLDSSRYLDLASLLQTFFAYNPLDVARYDEALTRFKESVPALASSLRNVIARAHESQPAFQAAYQRFHQICQTAIDPRISREQIDEMLIQHLMTERLIRNIFNNPDFSRRNVIAAAIEDVIAALTSPAFSRDDYLRSLNTYYQAIESAAERLDFTSKQRVLNEVYERFFQGYSTRVADTHGIVYTPQEIVAFMCQSVLDILRDEFGKTLADPNMVILDPCTGTGSFIVQLLRRANLPPPALQNLYQKRLFANEVLLMPYYVAALNIEYTFYELFGSYAPFEGLCFVDTLEIAERKQLSFLTERNTERVIRQRESPITIIIGNPPYNAWQRRENDNNKNRQYQHLDGRIRETYAAASRATLRNSLYDPYVRFFRWAADRLEGRDGIVAFISNNSFIDGYAFDGMRKHLLEDFTYVYHLNLGGNVRKNPKLSGTTHNVFGIQVGVGITIAVRHGEERRDRRVLYHAVGDYWRAEQKRAYLESLESVRRVAWQTLTPDAQHNWLPVAGLEAFGSLLPMGAKDAKMGMEGAPQTIFATFSRGVATSRDDVVYDFRRKHLTTRVEQFIDAYLAELDRYKRASDKNKLSSQEESGKKGEARKKNEIDIDRFVDYSRLKWDGTLKGHLRRKRETEFDETKVRSSLYRPFCKQWLYFDRMLINSVYLQHRFFPTPETEAENRVICLTGVGSEKPFMVMLTNLISDLHLVGAGSASQCFPFYTYAEDGTDRRENITDWALAQFRAHYSDESISKWDIFYYIYAVLHQPEYRERFAEPLKKELPRIPFAPDFWAYARAGRQLGDLHVNYESAPEYPLREVWAQGKPMSYRVEGAMKLRPSSAGGKYVLEVNSSLRLEDIPSEALEYKLGNRSALEWLVEQYRVKDGRDPNGYGDEQYLVKLVKRVVQASLETLRIVRELPNLF